MAFEPAVDMNTKEEALQILVDKGILTKTDFDKCKRVLSKKSTVGGCIYRDKSIVVYYKGYKEQTMFSGKGIKFFLIVENRTNEPVSIHGTFGLNGIIVEKDIVCASNLLGKAKAIAEITFFYSKLDMIDIYSVSNIEKFSFGFWYTNKQGRVLSDLEKLKDISLQV